MTPGARPSRRGFTLLEMLIVVGVMVLLIALVTGVGVSVLRGRETAATKNLLITLDRALDEYKLRVGSFPPYVVEDYEYVPGEDVELGNSVYFRTMGNKEHPIRPDAAVFIKQAMQVPECAEILTGLNERFLVLTLTDESADRKKNDVTPSVVDSWSKGGWGKPWDPLDENHLVYYVHPDNLFAQALYGRCVNRRPYFFSPGGDGKYGFRSEDAPKGSNESVAEYQARIEGLLADNVYSYTPEAFNQDPDFFNAER